MLLDVIMSSFTPDIWAAEDAEDWRYFSFEVNAPICLNASMFARIIRDPTSPTEEVSIRVFYESLQIAFPNNVLVSQFHGWSLQSARHPTEERGGVSRAH